MKSEKLFRLTFYRNDSRSKTGGDNRQWKSEVIVPESEVARAIATAHIKFGPVMVVKTEVKGE